MAKDMSLQLTDIGVLLKSILWFRRIISKALGTQAWSNEVVTELNDVTFQRQQACTPIGLHVLGGVTLPGFEIMEPLEAQKAEFVESTLPFGRRLLATVHVHPPCGRVTPDVDVGRTCKDRCLTDTRWDPRTCHVAVNNCHTQ
jgi:hypothetical protein